MHKNIYLYSPNSSVAGNDHVNDILPRDYLRMQWAKDTECLPGANFGNT